MKEAPRAVRREPGVGTRWTIAACAAVLCSAAWAADRFVQKVPLAKGLVAVVAEGDLEARSIGSYSVRAYFDEQASPGNETTSIPQECCAPERAPCARPQRWRCRAAPTPCSWW